ncbi:MAG: TolB family protein [Planctomycetota bacterium]
MSRNWLLVAVLALIVASSALAKKPPKPPPPDPEPDPDPAIAYCTTVRQLWVMNADGTNRTLVLDVGSGAKLGRADWSPPSWTPPAGWPQDGTPYLVFWSDVDGPGIYVIRVDGTDLRKVTDTTAWYSSVSVAPRPVWSPAPVPAAGDNRYRIAYTDGASEAAPRELYIVSPNGSDPTRLTQSPEGEMDATWSPSAGRLVVSLAHDNDDRYGMYELSSGAYTTHAHAGPLLGRSMTSPEWARTQEDKIAWAESAWIGAGGIWIVDLDEPANPLCIADSSEFEYWSPSWSPDDAKIVLAEIAVRSKGKRGRTRRISTVTATDGSAYQVILEDQSQKPAWRR